MIEFYLALERAAGSGNIHKARTAARSLGLKFTNQDSSRWLKPFIDSASARSDGKIESQSAPVAAPGLGTSAQVPSPSVNDEEKQVPLKSESAPIRHLNGTANGLTRDNVIPSTSNSSSLRSDGPPELFSTPRDATVAVASRPRKPRPEPDVSWVEPLIAQARTLQSETLRSLGPETGRLILGRYHALKFGNCTRNERANKAKGLQVASAIASMSRSQIYGSMTVGEYVGYARKVHEARDGAPWFDPWQIKAFCEFETGGAA